MTHKTIQIIIILLVLLQTTNGLKERKYQPTKNEAKAGPLIINLHQMPTPSTTQISHESAKGKEWISLTPGNTLLEMHNGTRETWTPPSFTGYPSTGFTGKKWKGIAYSTDSGSPTGEWQTRPPASTLNLGYTSYAIHGGMHDDVATAALENTTLKDNFFFIQSPSYLRYLLPACPNFTPESKDLAGECPERVMPPGEWKFSIIGLLSGTNINSLKGGRPLPTASHDYEKKVEKDISKYKTLIYSTILDVGAMGKDAVFEAEFPDGSKKKFSEIASTTNINDAKLRMTGPQSTYPVTLTFIKYYGVGSYTRKVEDFVCTKEESHSQGNTFGKCTRDVTEMKDGDDGKPNNDIGTAAAKGSVGDPVLKMEKIKEMVVTIRPASCMNRPAKPSEPWPDKNPDCAWWYTAEGHGGDKWAVDDEKDPQEEVGQPKDDQTYCESGYCFHIDFHIDLGGEGLNDRTIFGNPDNAVVNGIDKGTFFVYDPTIDGGPFTQPFPLLYIALIIVGVLVTCCCIGGFIYFTRKKKIKNNMEAGVAMTKQQGTV